MIKLKAWEDEGRRAKNKTLQWPNRKIWKKLS